MIYGYTAAAEHAAEIESAFACYASTHMLSLEMLIRDPGAIKYDWDKRRLYDVVMHAPKGTEIFVYEGSDIGRSMGQIVKAMTCFAKRGIIIHFVKYGQVFTAERAVDIINFLELMQHIESDFIAKRTTDALVKRKAACSQGVQRSKSKATSKLKLDKHKKEIEHYLKLKVSKASIARLVDCHPQTLYNYIEKRFKSKETTE